MSFSLTTQAWEQSGQKGNRLLLLVALAYHANEDGLAWPAVGTLAAKVRVSDRYIQLMLKDLEAAGEISIHESQGPGGVNLYHVHPQACQAEEVPAAAAAPLAESSLGVNHGSPPPNHGSPLAESSPVNHDSPGGENMITGGRKHDHRGVNHGSPKLTWNLHGTDRESPPPTPAIGAGPFGNDWDFGEEAEASYQVLGAEDEYLDDLVEVGGGGVDEEEIWELPATPLKPIERVVIGGLVGGGGDWQAQDYERLTAGGVEVAPQSAAPPAATAEDISWPECAQALRAKDIGVQYPDALRTCGLPYRAVVKQARQLARGGAGGGAIVNWFRKSENIEVLRAELARPVAVVVDAAEPAPPPAAAQRPAWCSAEAWATANEKLRAKIEDAIQEGGWLWSSGRRQQELINGKYRRDVIAVLRASGIEPAPPPEPTTKSARPAAPGLWRPA